MEIIEVLLVITLLFTLMSAIIKQTPPVQQEGNLPVLQRYATDASNMLCNSDRARRVVTGAAAMDWINESLAYVMPENLKYSVIVLDAGVIVKETGYALEERDTIATASCEASHGGVTRQVVVRAWR
jgi:hypothetical protein